MCPFTFEPILEHFRQQVELLLRDQDRSTSFARFQAILDRTQNPYSSFVREDERIKKYMQVEMIDRLSLLEPVEDHLVHAMRQELEREFRDA